MENSLGVGFFNGLFFSSLIVIVVVGFVFCQILSCNLFGILVLYGMCFVCYIGCIYSFINLGGRLVGNFVLFSVRFVFLLLFLLDVINRNQVFFGVVVGKKGVLCVFFGCFNEGVFQFKDLCEECYKGRLVVFL